MLKKLFTAAAIAACLAAAPSRAETPTTTIDQVGVDDAGASAYAMRYHHRHWRHPRHHRHHHHRYHHHHRHHYRHHRHHHHHHRFYY